MGCVSTLAGTSWADWHRYAGHHLWTRTECWSPGRQTCVAQATHHGTGTVRTAGTWILQPVKKRKKSLKTMSRKEQAEQAPKCFVLKVKKKKLFVFQTLMTFWNGSRSPECAQFNQSYHHAEFRRTPSRQENTNSQVKISSCLLKQEIIAALEKKIIFWPFLHKSSGIRRWTQRMTWGGWPWCL